MNTFMYFPFVGVMFITNRKYAFFYQTVISDGPI